MEPMAMGDLVVAAPHAIFGLPEVIKIGLFALTEDAAEGRTAFREKRKPNWSGR